MPVQVLFQKWRGYGAIQTERPPSSCFRPQQDKVPKVDGPPVLPDKFAVDLSGRFSARGQPEQRPAD